MCIAIVNGLHVLKSFSACMHVGLGLYYYYFFLCDYLL